MALAFLLLMTWGALSYRTDTGDVVPHLAQVLGLGTNKQARRILHGVLMASAFVFAVLGYVFIFVAHVRINESQIGLNTTWDRALHVWLGYVLLTWLCLQVAAGILPAGEQPEWSVAVLKLHGTSGKYLLGLGSRRALGVQHASPSCTVRSRGAEKCRVGGSSEIGGVHTCKVRVCLHTFVTPHVAARTQQVRAPT
jgi:hypothetical protein